MEEIHQELFDGSTSGKSLKEAGIDFDQKLNVFSGRLNDCEISGFSFGIKNKEQLFTVFDDFYPVSYPKINGIEVYGSFVNSLIIKNEVALLIRVEPLNEQVNKVADSIWYARGNESPFNNEDLEEETILSEEIFDEERENLFPVASFDPNEKNYNELKDSVQLVLQNKKLANILDELFNQNINLIASNRLFEKQLTHPVEAVFFLDNARNLKEPNELWYLQTFFPDINKDIDGLYDGNFILGDLSIIDNENGSVDSRINEIAKINHLSNDQLDLIYSVLNKYGGLSAFQLEMLTHSESPWIEARGNKAPHESCNTVIPKSRMKEFYSSLIAS